MKGLNSMAKNDDKDVLQRYDGRGCMLKIKQCLSIDKMELSFVSYGSDNKATANVNCYLDAVDFGLLCESIRTRELQTAIAKEKARALAAGELYPKVIYTSPMGGRKTDKGAVSRYFTIAPGSKADVVFTGYAFNASVSSTGAFIPTKGERPIASIRVSCTYHALAQLAYKWQWLEKDYMSKKYNMEAMKSEYSREDNDNGTEKSEGISKQEGQPAQPNAPAPEQPIQVTNNESDGFVPASESPFPFE